MKVPELLAPAGSIESMRAAVNAGADAVYMGGPKYGARAYADNPDLEGLIKTLRFLHLYGRKLYLTVNTLIKEREMGEEVISFLRPLYEEGLDAVIVQDYGVTALIRETFPALPIHASTQMAVSSEFGARLLSDIGISRVVLPRELSLEDIKSVAERGEIETECFIHGALCYCYSGQCLMSSIIGGRSGNRGRCAQVCRLGFPKEHLLNLKDLNTLTILPDIIDTGVDSLKIEGRMKSPRYTAGVTSVYRKYIDMYATLGRDGYKVSAADKKLLTELYDRGGNTTGYFTRHNGKDMIFKGDKPEMREVSAKTLEAIDKKYIDNNVKIPVQAEITILAGIPLRMTLTDGHKTVTAYGDPVSRAQNRPLSEEDVKRSISKFGDTCFELTDLNINMNPDAFLPVSALNSLRRNASDELEKERINGYKRVNF